MTSKSLLTATAVALALAGCRGAGGTGRESAPPDIDVSCVAEPADVSCTFANRGGAGERCVKVLLAAPATATVVVSDVLCSGRLGVGGSVTVPARLPRRPSDICGQPAQCLVRIVEPNAAESAALAWQDELRTALAPPTQKECERLMERLYQLTLEEQTRGLPASERAAYEEQLRRLWEQHEADLTQRCRNHLGRAQLECALQATSLEEAQRCERGPVGPGAAAAGSDEPERRPDGGAPAP